MPGCHVDAPEQQFIHACWSLLLPCSCINKQTLPHSIVSEAHLSAILPFCLKASTNASRCTWAALAAAATCQHRTLERATCGSA